MIAARSSRRKPASQALLALAGFILTILGQGLVAGQSFVLDGVFLYGFGLALAWSALPPAPSAADPQSDSIRTRDRALPIALGTVALGANAAGLIYFAGGASPNSAWVLYLVSVATALLALWRLDGPRPRIALQRPSEHVLVLLGIVLVGLLFRIYRIDSLPAGLWWDEAFSGLHVQQILADPSYRPVFVGGRGPGATAIWYTMAPFLLLFGPTGIALRATAVLAGTLGVIATYLLGRELFGRRVGLVAAAIIAVLTWQVNFSRIGFNAIWSVTLDAFAAYLLIRAIRTRRLFDFAVGGAIFGLAANMYYTTRLLPIVLAAYLLHRFAIERGAFLRRTLPGLLVFSAVCLLTISPLVQFAIANPDEFASRISEASIFNEVSSSGSYEPILVNLREHVLMFNYSGDNNGRHNLPGAPMLDQVVGAAFVVGLALCLRGARRPEHSFLLVWVPTMLVSGVLSLSFEAPQALRTVDETTAVALVAALPIVGLWKAFEALPIGRVRVRLWSFARPSLAATLVAGLLVVIAGLNYDRYFVKQANDFAVWAAFSTAETIVGQRASALPMGTQVYLDETFLDNPTIEFLTQGAIEFRRFEQSSSLPFRVSSDIAVFLTPELETAARDISRFYSGAVVQDIGPDFPSPPVLIEATVPAVEVAALQGAVAAYYPAGFDSRPALSETVTSLDLDFSEQAPLAFPFSVEVRGTLVVPDYGQYVFTLDARETGELFVDETAVALTGEQTTLARGIHTLRLRATLKEPSRVLLLWSSPGANAPPVVISDGLFAPSAPSTGLLGAYYPNASWSGPPALEQIDPELAIRLHILPLQQPYSVEWRGKLVVPTEGVYVFGVESSSDAWIYVDDQPAATDEGAPREIREGRPLQLSAGLHDIRVRFVDSAPFSFINVFWSPPGGSQQIIPGERLLPPRGAYPEPEIIPAESAQTSGTWVEGGIPRAAFSLSGLLGADAQLKDPRGVAVDSDGNVYVADTGNARIVKLSPTGDVVATWGKPGTGEGELEEPVAVAVERSGSILVLDAAKGYIQRFSANGDFQARFAGPSLNPYHPRGLGVDDTGGIFVADTGSSRILQLEEGGRLVRRLGQRGKGSGQLVEPTDVTPLPEGGFVVVDSANDRALRLDSDFGLVVEWALPPAESIWGPHLALDGFGGIFVSDPDHGRVIRYGPDGKPLDQVGDPSELGRPVGLATDSAGRLYAADSQRGVIVVYEPER